MVSEKVSNAANTNAAVKRQENQERTRNKKQKAREKTPSEGERREDERNDCSKERSQIQRIKPFHSLNTSTLSILRHTQRVSYGTSSLWHPQYSRVLLLLPVFVMCLG